MNIFNTPELRDAVKTVLLTMIDNVERLELEVASLRAKRARLIVEAGPKSRRRLVRRRGVIVKPRPPCSVEGCKRPLQAKGLCTTHYSRQRRSR